MLFFDGQDLFEDAPVDDIGTGWVGQGTLVMNEGNGVLLLGLVFCDVEELVEVDLLNVAELLYL